MNTEMIAKAKDILAGSEGTIQGKVGAIMAELRQLNADYGWVGVYLLRDDALLLGPYSGPPTDHVRIAIGRGVCGTAVAKNQDQNVADVRALKNYLACNTFTRSELVVLIRDESGAILGQIDIDSNQVNAFDADREAETQALASLLAPYLPHVHPV